MQAASSRSALQAPPSSRLSTHTTHNRPLDSQSARQRRARLRLPPPELSHPQRAEHAARRHVELLWLPKIGMRSPDRRRMPASIGRLVASSFSLGTVVRAHLGPEEAVISSLEPSNGARPRSGPHLGQAPRGQGNAPNVHRASRGPVQDLCVPALAGPGGNGCNNLYNYPIL